MFSWFRKNKEAEKQAPKEFIKIINNKGREERVEKSVWLEKEFYPSLKANENQPDVLYDILMTAIEYGIKFETVEYCLRLYNDHQESEKYANLLFHCYVGNKMYVQAIAIYEDLVERGYELNYIMYYNLACAQEKMNDFKAMEKSLFFSFKKNENYTKTNEKLIEYMKKDGSLEYFDWLKDLANNSKSYYLNKELSIEQFKKGLSQDGVKSALKAFDCSSQIEKNIIEIGDILKQNQRYDEFANYILPKYSYMNSSTKFHELVLDFYLKDNQVESGLKLLKDLYLNEKYSDMFVRYEKLFILKKLRENSPAKFEAYLKSNPCGKMNITELKGSLYNKIFKPEESQRTGKNFIILPFTANSVSTNYNEWFKMFIKNISLYLNELLYLNSDLNVRALFMYDELGPNFINRAYSEQYYKQIKMASPSVDYILSGQVTEYDPNGSFELKIYVYDTEKNQKLDVFITKISSETYLEVIEKFLNVSFKRMFEIQLKAMKLYDKNSISYFADYVDIISSLNAYNKYRYYQTDRILKYCIKNPSDHNLNVALSLIYKQAGSTPEIRAKYRNAIYKEIVTGEYSKKILENFKKVYGEENEQNND